MRIDRMVSLAASVQESPGVYALLLGSGISRSAGVPMGWEVQLELIRRVAAVRGDDPGPDLRPGIASATLPPQHRGCGEPPHEVFGPLELVVGTRLDHISGQRERDRTARVAFR
jgi:hypothetical protein